MTTFLSMPMLHEPHGMYSGQRIRLASFSRSGGCAVGSCRSVPARYRLAITLISSDLFSLSLGSMLPILSVLGAWLVLGLQPASAQAIPPAKPDAGVAAYAFDMSQVTLDKGRWHDNQDRTLSYLKFVDVDRMLYVYRSNHKLDTQNAQANGGWDAPTYVSTWAFEILVLITIPLSGSPSAAICKATSSLLGRNAMPSYETTPARTAL